MQAIIHDDTSHAVGYSLPSSTSTPTSPYNFQQKKSFKNSNFLCHVHTINTWFFNVISVYHIIPKKPKPRDKKKNFSKAISSSSPSHTALHSLLKEKYENDFI